MIEHISEPMIMVNPKLTEHYHCAIISSTQTDNSQRFSYNEIKNKLEITNEILPPTYQDLLKSILIRFENPFIEITRNEYGQDKKAFLIYHSDLDILTTRAVVLSYLFNQKKTIIFPKQVESMVIYKLKTQSHIQFKQQIEPKKTIEDSLLSLFEITNSKRMTLELAENYDFLAKNTFGKMALHQQGKQIDKKLQQIFKQSNVKFC